MMMRTKMRMGRRTRMTRMTRTRMRKIVIWRMRRMKRVVLRQISQVKFLFHLIRIHHLRLNTDPDPIRFEGFDYQKLTAENFFFYQTTILPIPRLL
jgi:hypothetical protein